MGVFFRKSFSLGPLRINLSKGGAGIAGGISGAHLGVNARGPYVTAGKGGIYFHKTLADGHREIQEFKSWNNVLVFLFLGFTLFMLSAIVFLIWLLNSR